MPKNNLTGSCPETEEVFEIYRKADAIQKMAPWEWMHETDIFVIQASENSQKFFVSVMGMETKEHSIAIFKEAEHAYSLFNCSLDAYDETDPSLIMEIPHLRIFFENGILPTIFFKCIPGRAPAPVENEDHRIFSLVLDQCLKLFPILVVEGAEELSEKIEEENLFLHCHKIASTRQQEFKHVPRPEGKTSTDKIDPAITEHIKSKPVGSRFQIDFRVLSNRVSGKDGIDDYLPYLLLMFSQDKDGNTAVDHHAFIAEYGIEQMLAAVRQRVIYHLTALPYRPEVINCFTERIGFLMKPVFDQAGIPFYLIDRPEYIDRIYEQADQLF